MQRKQRFLLGWGLGAVGTLMVAGATILAVPGLTTGAAHAAPLTPTTIKVTNCSSYSGTGSLAAALTTASTATNPDIQFACGTGTYDIIVPTSTVNYTLTLDGHGEHITLDGNHSNQVIDVQATGNLTLNDLTIANGVAAGSPGGNGGNGAAGLNGVSGVNGTDGGPGGDGTAGGKGGDGAMAQGGGIYNAGTLTLTNSTLTGNSATGGAGGTGGTGGVGGNGGNGGTGANGGVVGGNGGNGGPGGLGGPDGFGGDGGYGLGGGIYNLGTLTLTNSTLTGNSATGGAGGAAGAGGAGGTGGAGGNGGNGANGLPGGSIGGIGGNGGSGGAGTSGLPGSIGGNGLGGGIYNAGTLTLTNSTLTGNSTSAGAGGAGGTGGAGGNGGVAGAGGTGFDSSGTPIPAPGGVSGSSGLTGFSGLGGPSGYDAGGGIANSGTLSIGATIVAANSALAGDNCSLAGAVTTTDLGYNLENQSGGTPPTDCGFTSANHDVFTTTSAQLGLSALASNGGPTQTMALQTGSLAIDAIPTSTRFTLGATTQNACPTTDQRGYGRPDGAESACDVGAYESGAIAPTSPSSPSTGLSGNGSTTSPLTAQAPKTTGNSATAGSASSAQATNGGTQTAAGVTTGHGTLSSGIPLWLVTLLTILGFCLLGGGAVTLVHARKVQP